MDKLGIIHVRLDERLIHGQVATMWLGNLGITRVMIVDDSVVKDELAKASLKTAVPGGLRLSILKTETAAARLLEGIYQDQRVMIICKQIDTIFRLIELGVPIDAFNLGNTSKREGTIKVTKSVFLTNEAIETIKQLEKNGVTVTSQMVPMEDKLPFSTFFND